MSISGSLELKLLIVEDDKFMQSILSKYFSNLFQLQIFSDGLDAFSYLQNGNIPDLIITDLKTPKLGGF